MIVRKLNLYMFNMCKIFSWYCHQTFAFLVLSSWPSLCNRNFTKFSLWPEDSSNSRKTKNLTGHENSKCTVIQCSDHIHWRFPNFGWAACQSVSLPNCSNYHKIWDVNTSVVWFQGWNPNLVSVYVHCCSNGTTHSHTMLSTWIAMIFIHGIT